MYNSTSYCTRKGTFPNETDFRMKREKEKCECLTTLVVERRRVRNSSVNEFESYGRIKYEKGGMIT